MQAFSAQTGQRASRGGGLYRAGDILKRQHADLVVSPHKLRQAEGITLVREKTRSRQSDPGVCHPAIRSVRTTHQAAGGIDAALRAAQRVLHTSDHRQSRFRITFWAGPAGPDLSFYSCRPPAEPDHPVQIRRPNAGYLRHGQGRQGIPPLGRRL
jgi:hypothetical protein